MMDTCKTEFSKNIYMTWYEKMLLIRRFEEKAGQLYGQQKITGFCHLYIGQEACAVGTATALQKEDKWIAAYRDHGIPLALGTNPNILMAELFARITGCSKGKGGSMHFFDKKVHFMGGHGIVGGQIPLGAGIAFSELYQGTKNICICFMGDGAVRQGSFHETLNMAMTWKLPVIFVIENNGYAMGTSVERTSNVTDLYNLGKAYNMPSMLVNGMKIEEVHKSINSSAEHARNGKGPTLLEFRTYRYKGHSMSDPAKYRTKEELRKSKTLDPIERVKVILLEKKYISQEELKEIDIKTKNRILEAVSFSEKSPFPDAKEIFNDVYVQVDYPFIKE